MEASNSEIAPGISYVFDGAKDYYVVFGTKMTFAEYQQFAMLVAAAIPKPQFDDVTPNSFRQPNVGDHVIYVDSVRVKRDAIITAVWVGEYGVKAPVGVNLVVVSSDENRQDQYGRQTERFTSVCHKSSQPAPGNYWCFPSELNNR